MYLLGITWLCLNLKYAQQQMFWMLPPPNLDFVQPPLCVCWHPDGDKEGLVPLSFDSLSDIHTPQQRGKMQTHNSWFTRCFPEKDHYPCFSQKQIIAAKLGVVLYMCDQLPLWPDLGLVHILSMLLKPLCIQIYICSAVLWCFSHCLSPLGLILFLSPFLCRSLSLEGQGLMKISHLGLSAPKFLIFAHVQLWVSVLITIYCKKKLFLWGLSDVLIYGNSNMSCIVSSLLCPFSRIIVVGSP